MSIVTDLSMREWEATMPRSMREELVWKFHPYRVALYLAYLATEDARRALGCTRNASACDQLVRAVASAGANIAEGYRRTLPRDRSRFYDSAVGSLREAGACYVAARAFLPDETVNSRIDHLAELRRMLFGAIRSLRALSPERRIEA